MHLGLYSLARESVHTASEEVGAIWRPQQQMVQLALPASSPRRQDAGARALFPGRRRAALTGGGLAGGVVVGPLLEALHAQALEAAVGVDAAL